MRPSLGINTYGYIWTTAAAGCVRRLGRLGYRTFELVVNPPHVGLDDMSGPERRRLGNELRAEGLTLLSLNLPSLDVNLASPLACTRAYSVQVYRDAIDLASDLGIPYLILVPGRMNPLLPPALALRTAWMNEGLDLLLPYAATRDVSFLIENVPYASFPDAGTLGDFVRGFGADTLGVCYDAANAHFIGEAPVDGLRALKELVRIVHLSDSTRSQWRHDEVGAGDVPFASIPPVLEEIRFQGDCLLEIAVPDPEAAILRSHRALEASGFASCSTGDSR